ncbi:hypothetical protein [Xenorhabdus innexi]|uniref:Uncharacterized protein n=1 Tax=Xenorhabdus innexi TaxID=290109 RepID=A0A1N6MRU8_9GAMM|nr:hypothetical protein [Xenorhabdus innexi]PHM38559.1 hypothetical protein Xinn_00256 [Xenorhabdus innexi]SIP71557.1 conserved hypothetical protein [Xenorhabdus innexi]
MCSTIPTPVELNKGRIKFGALLVRPLRKSVVSQFSRYQVEDGIYCYGKFDSRDQALRYCLQLYRIKLHERIKEGAAQI